MKYPQNKIQENRYTIGGEFIEKSSNRDYKGSYFIIGNQYFIGAKFKANADELIKKTNSQLSISSIGFINYSFLNKNKKLIQPNIVSSFIFSPTEAEIKNGITQRYFTKKLNINPNSIKEVSKDNFNTLKSDPFYKTININWFIGLNNDKNIEEGNQKLPGLREFLL